MLFVSVGPPDGPLAHPGVVVIEDDFVSFGASFIGQIQLVRV